MHVRKIVILLVFAIIWAQPLLRFTLTHVEADPDPITVPDDYPTIQYAIGNATEGETIFIRSGTYKESIIIDKRLTIQGEDKASTFIDGMQSGDVVEITADDVEFSGFTLFNASDDGIYIHNANNTSIYDCSIHNCSDEGIYAWQSDNASIENCTIYWTGDHGIYLDISHGAFIAGCDIHHTPDDGIHLGNSHDVVIIGCEIYHTSSQGIKIDVSLGTQIIDCDLYNNSYHGIYIYDSDDTWIMDCDVYNNSGSRALEVYRSDYTRIVDSRIHENNQDGIYLTRSDDAVIAGCKVYNNSNCGIKIINSYHVLIEDCETFNNSNGITLDASDLVSIKNCRIFQNACDGISHDGSDITTICNCTIYNNNYGIYSYASLKTYVARSSLFNNTSYGLYMEESSGVTANTNYTDNDYGISSYKSVCRARYCSFEGNYYGINSGSLSTFNATGNWWGNETGPYHPSLNPTGTGDRVSEYVEFDPWQTSLYQPETLINDLRCHLTELEWNVVYPDRETPKPLDCGAAMVSDWLASAYVTTKLSDYSEGLDTNATFVDQSTGEAVGDAGMGILTFGGQFVNPVVKYAESVGTPDADRAPVMFHEEDGTFHFQYKNGTDIPGAELPKSVINFDEDMFVIEVYRDGDGRLMMLCYGFGWQGTYAAGKYFDTVIYPDLTSYPFSWIIVKWEDSNGDGFVNNPGEGDAYTPIAAGA
jgi:parallel beta-helix repeat protein